MKTSGFIKRISIDGKLKGRVFLACIPGDLEKNQPGKRYIPDNIL